MASKGAHSLPDPVPVMTLRAPLAPLIVVPVTIVMLPDADALAEAPEDIVTPPLCVVAVPVDRTAAPDVPPTARPLTMDRSPVGPLLVVPLLNTREPEMPADLASPD